MHTTAIEVRELPARLEEVMAELAAGADVILTDQEVPCARLTALPALPPRRSGLHQGLIEASDDFDVLLPDEFWLGRA